MNIQTSIQQDGVPAPAPEGIHKNWVRVAAPQNKQWTTAMDGVDKLKLAEADIPVPNDGEVLVKIQAVSVNYRDVEGAFVFLSLILIASCINLREAYIMLITPCSLRGRLQPLQHPG